MLVADGEVYVSLTVRGSVKCTFHQVFLHRRTGTLGIFVEQQQAFRQLSVVQSLSLQHIGSHSLVVAFSNECLDALTLVLLAGSVECLVESKLLDGVEIFLLEVSCGHIVVGIHKGKHVLEHAAGST